MSDAAPTEAAKGGKKKLILILAVVLVLGGGGGVGAMLLLGGDAEAEEVAEEAPPEEGLVAPVAEMTANLAGPTTAFARVQFSAVLTADAKLADVEPKFPLLKDAAISELSTFQADHLRTTQGMEDLRVRLAERAAEIYPDGQVLRIILTELLVQ
jgi:flagellar protein FliL